MICDQKTTSMLQGLTDRLGNTELTERQTCKYTNYGTIQITK